MNAWLNIGQAAKYAGVNRKTFRPWLDNGLRHIQKGSIVRTKPEWIDDYMCQFESKGAALDLDEMLKGII